MTANTDGMSSIENIHQQMENDPHYPYALQSEWLPEAGSEAMQEFFEMVLTAKKRPLSKSVKAMQTMIKRNDVLRYLVENACQENLNILDSHLKSAKAAGSPIPRIKDLETLLHGFNVLLTHAPAFHANDQLVGLPYSAWVVGIDPTLGGTTLFRLPMFNEKMAAILQEWNKFLGTKASNVGFRTEGQGWLSPTAKQSYQFYEPDGKTLYWNTDYPKAPYWKSWNSFFTRQFANPKKQRPIADPKSNATVISPNDGTLFRWDPDVSERDVFWFKDMKYSLSDILSSSVPAQQKIIDKYELVEKFKGGYIFQTYLNPYNFHRWWVPVNGRVLFTPFAIPGCFFSKLVIPDFSGATTASTPYLAQVNARGLIVFETDDYGLVACLPLGMSEVSSVSFDKKMKAGAAVRKGDEMGTFNYGGSSFAVLYQNLPSYELEFVNAAGVKYPRRPKLPSGSAGSGGSPTSVGAQIGKWVPKTWLKSGNAPRE